MCNASIKVMWHLPFFRTPLASIEGSVKLDSTIHPWVSSHTASIFWRSSRANLQLQRCDHLRAKPSCTQTIGEQATGEQATGEQASGKQTTGEQATVEQATSEQANAAVAATAAAAGAAAAAAAAAAAGATAAAAAAPLKNQQTIPSSELSYFSASLSTKPCSLGSDNPKRLRIQPSNSPPRS